MLFQDGVSLGTPCPVFGSLISTFLPLSLEDSDTQARPYGKKLLMFGTLRYLRLRGGLDRLQEPVYPKGPFTDTETTEGNFLFLWFFYRCC